MPQSPMSRRELLALAATAAAAPIAHAQSAPVQSANDGLGFLLVGCGSRGSSATLGAVPFGRIVATADVDSAQSDAFCKRLAATQKTRPEYYKDYRRAIERKDVDAVIVGTPDHWHTAILIAAARAGKDVYCEKPMTLTINEGKQICRVVKDTGRVVQVGTQQRSEFNQRFLQAVAIARSGRLGKTLSATCMVGHGKASGPFETSDPPSTFDWDMWLGQAPKVPYTRQRGHRSFRSFFEYSGGTMTDWGAHHIDIAQWAIGAENTGPVEIEGYGELPLGGKKVVGLLTGKVPPGEIENSYNTAVYFRVLLKYANGSQVIVQDGPGNGIDMEGDRSSLFVARSRLVGRAIDEIKASDRETTWLADEVVKLYGGNKPTLHMANFVQAVKDRGKPISDVFTHHRSVSACHLANISLLLGRRLRWDPEKEDFIGDREASALLQRPQRKPYTVEA